MSLHSQTTLLLKNALRTLQAKCIWRSIVIKGLYIGLDDNPEWKDNKKEGIIQVLECMEDISKTATKIYIEAAKQVLAEMEPPPKKKGLFVSLFS